MLLLVVSVAFAFQTLAAQQLDIQNRAWKSAAHNVSVATYGAANKMMWQSAQATPKEFGDTVPQAVVSIKSLKATEESELGGWRQIGQAVREEMKRKSYPVSDTTSPVEFGHELILILRNCHR